ncbi:MULTISPECIES: hypothetical protein [unclassified Bradyrhizobium]|uniref:hypothetical protein n=1 Tax=unclassified Bradyrhizobium TaxID=2631580 RepID=UPI0033971D5D
MLHVAQPALSQQLATLEGEVKQQLLNQTRGNTDGSWQGALPTRPAHPAPVRPGESGHERRRRGPVGCGVRRTGARHGCGQIGAARASAASHEI